MDFVKTQIQRIQQQLAGLTASQKMLTAALVAVMVMTLLYWGRYAGTAEMVPLFEQALSPSEMGQIQERLRARNIPFDPVADKIMVPADRQPEIFADLAWSKSLPLITEAGFDIMVKKLNPWAPGSERDAMFNRAKEITCSQIIGLFPDVEHASVVIDQTNTRHMGSRVEPSANITIRTRSGGDAKGNKLLAERAGAVVKGAVAALKLGGITVNVGEQVIRLRDTASEDGALAASAGDQLELKNKARQVEEERIGNILGYVPGVLVSVHVSLDNEIFDSTTQTIDGKNSITKDISTETNESETNDTPPTGEPGANPNIVANGVLDANGAVAASGGPRSRETTERIQSQVLPSYTREQRRRGPGETKVISATVRVPHSYFVNVVRTRRGLDATKVPEQAEVDAYAQAKLKEMELAVRGSAGMADGAMVTVAPYDDVNVPLGVTVPQTATMSIPLALGRHGKEVALGGLALVSLFMVSMMVKRSAPAAIIAVPAAATAGAPGPLMTAEALAGEAGTGDAMLDGMELDEDAVKTQQMLEQVSTLVKDNPDAAASLVKRWLNRD